MNREPVQSSDLKSVGYETATRILTIEFNSGGIYDYLEVPSSIHEGLMHASSKGKYFHQNIKDRYKFRRVS
jgi:hypothetical protein